MYVLSMACAQIISLSNILSTDARNADNLNCDKKNNFENLHLIEDPG